MKKQLNIPQRGELKRIAECGDDGTTYSIGRGTGQSLLKRGLIVYVPDPEGRRGVHKITEAGKQALDAAQS